MGIQVVSRVDLWGSRSNVWWVRIPYWLLTAPLIIAPAYQAVTAAAVRRALRRQTGQCTNCGYDLRASRERCPECGTTIDDSAARHAALARYRRWWEQNRPSSPAAFVAASLACSTAFILVASGLLWRLSWPSGLMDLVWTAAPFLAAFLALAAVLEARRRAKYSRLARLTLVLGTLAACSRLLVSLVVGR